MAKVIGEKGVSNFTDSEKENGFEQVWVSFNEALNILTECKARSVEGRDYIVPRDIVFLEEARIKLVDLAG